MAKQIQTSSPNLLKEACVFGRWALDDGRKMATMFGRSEALKKIFLPCHFVRCFMELVESLPSHSSRMYYPRMYIGKWKSTFSNRKYIYKWWIFHGYVSLPECRLYGHGILSNQKSKPSKDPVIELKPPVTVARKSEKKPQITPNKSLRRLDVWMVLDSRVFVNVGIPINFNKVTWIFRAPKKNAPTWRNPTPSR